MVKIKRILSEATEEELREYEERFNLMFNN